MAKKLHFRILEIVEYTHWGRVLLWRTAPWQLSIHYGVKLFTGWPGNCSDIKVMNFCELILRSCRTKNAPCRRASWKILFSRCGRPPHHHNFNCFTKAYQGTWKLKIIPTGNTAPTGTKENDVFSLLKMRNLIWKQILIDLLNRFYIIKKNHNWIVHWKYTER